MKIIDLSLVSISEAVRYYGVSVPTMRRWDNPALPLLQVSKGNQYR